MATKNYIVPHDFSKVADVALEHAIATAKIVGAEINVLHVIKRGSDVKESEEQLKKVLSKFKTTIKLIPNVRIGDIFEDIGDFAEEKGAELIFMGTHGTKGWQHITGSYALKVINGSTVPFICVQEQSPKDTGYDDIVVPMDLNIETKQKLAIVAGLAKYFDSRIHVVTPKETDEFIINKMNANITFAKRYFQELGIEITATIVPRNNFAQEVIKHAVSVDADLVAFMNLNKNNVFGVISANHELTLLNNEEKIPTLVMNPIEGLVFISYDHSGGRP